ncbi:hypothetical protein [Mesorhizobium sp. ES1-3]|uniref:hypothetical protein n=1 Tax=Mesorhizobium sp. ES1-3 TaxID=2876628 RepID=UPI001CCA19A7|nr:hypothetical protein [Mesorhizobium sp. ES1-3]MBZ9672303.1 hypothetical protein [Mesorhizobium sp. ES1-3]
MTPSEFLAENASCLLQAALAEKPGEPGDGRLRDAGAGSNLERTVESQKFRTRKGDGGEFFDLRRENELATSNPSFQIRKGRDRLVP